MKTLLKIVLPILVLVLCAAAAKMLVDSRVLPKAEPPAIPIPIVTTLAAELGDYRVHVPTRGTVVPRTESQLVVEVSGRVTSVSSQLVSGGFFDAGDVLLEVDPRDYEIALVQAQLEVVRAERRLAEEEADAQVARKEWERMGQGEASPLTLHEPQVAEAAALLEASKSMREGAQRDLERTRVLAPFSGRVRNKSVDLGQYVTRGASVAMVYATDVAEVRLPLPDGELAFLDLPFSASSAQGETLASVELHAEFAGERRSWDAHIVRTEGEIDPKTRMVMAVAQVDDPYGRRAPGREMPLALGMFVDADIRGKLIEDVFAFPRSALRDGGQIYVLDADDRLHFVPANVVRLERELALVRADIAAGSRIVVSPIEIVTDGMQVRDLGNDVAPESPSSAVGSTGGLQR